MEGKMNKRAMDINVLLRQIYDILIIHNYGINITRYENRQVKMSYFP